MERTINTIYFVDINSLTPDPDNANEHPNIDIIAASLQEHGQVTPIVVDIETDTIIKGNGTWEAAKTLGWKDIKIVYTNLDKERQLSYSIADNQSGRKSYWNLNKLGQNLKRYAEWNKDPNWNCMGFKKDEVEPLIGSKWDGDSEGFSGGANFEDEPPKPKLKSIKVSEEIYELFNECVKKLRKDSDYAMLTDEECLVVFLSEWKTTFEQK